MKLLNLVLGLVLFFQAILSHAQKIHIIPEPLQVVEKKGNFAFDVRTRIYIDPSAEDLQDVVHIFTGKFKRATGIELKYADAPARDTLNCLLLSIVPENGKSNREAYLLDIGEKNIKISASSSAGIFYALESLLQILPVNPTSANPKKRKVHIPSAFILDSPEFSYRGMHLDVSRHYFPIAFIEKYLDLLAAYKINVFHWHLTDSHGWRLEIKKYPRLTSVGAWRAARTGIPMTIAEPTGKGEAATYGGFYTQEEIKKTVEYARLRNIEIIPEIEMPGHCTAALVAYPQFSDLNNPVPLLVPCGYKGDLLHNFCAGYDSTYLFLQDILTEVMALFPSRYIHIGGDEVRPAPWLHCPRCLDRMEKAGLHSAKELQAYFTHRIDSFLTARGKRMIGWDEITGANIAPSSVAMSWHGESKAIEAIAKGNQVVMAPYRYTYFDFYQSPPGLEDEITYARLSIDSVYAFHPIPNGFTASQSTYILGGEACLWTENVSSTERVEYMLLPRLLALSEALWSSLSKKNYSFFVQKVADHLKYFDKENIHYARSMYNVDIIPTYDTLRSKIQIALRDQTQAYPIHYTIDGSIPTLKSPTYQSSFIVHKNSIVKAATFDKGRLLNKINTDSFAVHKALGCGIRFKKELSQSYKLLDGIFGTWEPYDNRWLHFTDSVLSFEIDLKQIQPLHSLALRFMEDQVGDIYLPLSVHISGSKDGNRYKQIVSIVNKKIPQSSLRHIVPYHKSFAGRFRYIKVEINNALINKDAAKNTVALDEIVVK